MKTLFTFALCLFAVVAHAANPSTKSFRATGGLAVTSNDITGLITYDGSGISSPTGGVSASTATNIARAAVLVAPGANVTVVTNSTGTNIIYTVATSGGSSGTGQPMTNILWSNTLFVNSLTGTNATAIRGDLSKPWRDAHIALLAATPGDCVFLLEGVHDIGTNVFNVGHGVKVMGQGQGSWLRGSAGLHTNGPVVGLTGSTSEVAHLTIENYGRNFYQAAVIGFHYLATNSQSAGTNMLIHDLTMFGDSDVIYLRSTNSWSLRGYNIRSFSKWDNLVMSIDSSNGVSRWTASYFESDLQGALNPLSIAQGNASAIKIERGIAEFVACDAVGTNGADIVAGHGTRALQNSGGFVRWSGGSLKAAGTNNVKVIDNTGGTIIYSGNQISMDDMTGHAVGGGIVFGSEQSVVTNIVYRAGGIVINDIDRLIDPIFISDQGGLNIGAMTDPGAARLQVGSLPGTGDYVASDANGLLFSTNGSAGGGSLVTNANQFAVDPTLTIKSNAFFTNTVFWGQLQDMNAGGTTNLDINGNTTLMYPQTANSGAFNIGPFGEGRYFAFSKSVGLLNMGSGAADTFKFTLASGAQTNAGPLSIAGAASFFSTVSIPTGATSNYVWTCTNATTGMGEWRASAGGGGGSNYLFDATVFNAPAGGGDVNVGIKSGAILPGVYADIGILYGGGVLDYGLYYDTGIDTLLYQDARFAPNYTNIAGISNGFWNFIVSPVLNDLPAGSLLRTTSAKRVGAVTIGANLTWDGTTLAATSGGGTGASTNEVLTNLIGTVVRNVTNVVSLSTSNATSKPITNSFTAGTLTLRGLEAGANTTITANGSNYVIASTGGGGLAGHSNAIAFINPQGTALTYYDSGSSLTNPGFGFDPRTLNGPNAGYGGLMVFANESMGLVTIGHPNPGSDFTGDTASALVISNRFAPANQGFTSDFVKIDAVEVTGGGGTSFNPDSTLTRWRVWSAASGSATSTASNDVAAITVDGRLKLAKAVEIAGPGGNGEIDIGGTNGPSKLTLTLGTNFLGTNTLAFSITNPVAGQMIKISSVSSNGGNFTSVITNAFDVIASSLSASNSTTSPFVVITGTNGVTIGTTNGSGGVKSFTLESGTWYPSAVPYIRPVQANSAGILDILANGTGVDSWIDVGSDYIASVGNGEFLHMRKKYNSYGYIAVTGLGSGSDRDLILQPTDRSTGRIGFGITNPAVKWHFKFDTNTVAQLTHENASAGTSAYASIAVKNNTGANDALFLHAMGTNWVDNGAFVGGGGVLEAGANLIGGLSIVARNASGVLRFYSGGFAAANERMRITSTGNVGFGTNSPQVLIHARQSGTSAIARFDSGIQSAVFTVTTNGISVGPSGVVITNVLSASATLDFPSTAAGAVSDLPITLSGAADGDVVSLGAVSASVTPLTGGYFAWASNGVCYVRFSNNNLASAQDPASGTFKILLTKF